MFGIPPATMSGSQTALAAPKLNDTPLTLSVVPSDSGANLDAKLDLSKAEDALGQSSQALQKLAPLLPEDRDGEIHFRAAGLYRKLGDSAHAKEALAVFQQLRAATDKASGGLTELDKELEDTNTPLNPK
jgi:hypothetical protein